MIPNDDFSSYPVYQRAEIEKNASSSIETFQLCQNLLNVRPKGNDTEEKSNEKPNKNKVLPIFIGAHLIRRIKKNEAKQAPLLVCVKEFQDLIEEFHLLLEVNRNRIYENKALRRHLETLFLLIQAEGMKLDSGQ